MQKFNPCIVASGLLILFTSFVLQEHEVLHDKLNKQNKALLQRVRELVDAGDEKDQRIQDFEAQAQSKAGDLVSKSFPIPL